ncbi:Protein of unknown function [Flavobacterium indicum GPTSA100-9 = DSM 17447]|uniref:DUF1330 domain-containing protein n=1 Tax=Flavobacterium indicum (strain DSM 17447 / CIP 109464 / GPTSA100-9) TaxID=1094466 RepID=H8XTN3_FLAIG|nr:DUF1330 domain-containing protein [Flavobacterium indicum]CCG53613.1 Protein of unknown function [Flavobacterium indicum GPTSA100-9 = DSM 17447]
MKIYLIINAIPNPSNMQDVQEYLGKIMPLFMQYSGSKIERFQIAEQLIGNSGIKMVGIFEFPDTQNIKDMLESDAFKSLSELRAKAFTQLDLFIGNPF